jgi:predicted nucleic acid-binding Zn ribbon protein
VSLAASRPPSGRILRLEGRAELPDQAVLTLRLFAAQETLREGRLEKSWRAAWTGQVTVKDRAFSVAPPAPEPGEVRVETSFRDEAQRRAVLKDLEGKIEVRQWDSVLPGWDDAHAAGLPARFAELEAAAGDSVRWLDGVAAAVSSEEEWKSRSAALSREGEGLLLRLQAASAFPASRTELERSVRTALIAGRHFAWKDGSFLGPVSYYPPLHSGEFSLAALRRAAEGAREVAGRELALWALKEARRGGAPSKLVAPHAAKPGFAPYAARLDAASGFDALEADIRAGR